MGDTISNMKKIIVTPHVEITFLNTFPKEWNDIEFMSPNELENMNEIPENVDIYATSDSGFDTISRKFNLIDQGFCRELSLMCNDKYKCRNELETLSDMPYTICGASQNYIVNWPYNQDDVLFAK